MSAFEPKMEMTEEIDQIADVKRRNYAELEPQKKESMATVPGVEGKSVAKGVHVGKSIAVFTSGGDAQGIIAFICSCNVAENTY